MATVKVWKPIEGKIQISRVAHPLDIKLINDQRKLQTPGPLGHWEVPRTRFRRALKILARKYDVQVFEDFTNGRCDVRCQEARWDTYPECVCSCRGVHHGGGGHVIRQVGETTLIIDDGERAVYFIPKES